jgi:hypothetical protein
VLGGLFQYFVTAKGFDYQEMINEMIKNEARKSLLEGKDRIVLRQY